MIDGEFGCLGESTPANVSKYSEEPCYKKKIGFAVLIILGVCGFVVAGVGCALSSLGQAQSVAMMAAGCGIGILCLSSLIVLSVKNCKNPSVVNTPQLTAEQTINPQRTDKSAETAQQEESGRSGAIKNGQDPSVVNTFQLTAEQTIEPQTTDKSTETAQQEESGRSDLLSWDEIAMRLDLDSKNTRSNIAPDERKLSNLMLTCKHPEIAFVPSILIRLMTIQVLAANTDRLLERCFCSGQKNGAGSASYETTVWHNILLVMAHLK